MDMHHCITVPCHSYNFSQAIEWKKKCIYPYICKEGRMPKNWRLPTVVLEKTPESPLESKGIKPVNLKRNQPWMFIRRTDVEAEASVFWSFDVNRTLIGKVPDGEKDWGQEEKRVSEKEMAGWHHQCKELGQTLGDGEGQGGLPCCSHGVAESRIWLGNSTATNISIHSPSSSENRANTNVLGLKSDLNLTVCVMHYTNANWMVRVQISSFYGIFHYDNSISQNNMH